jgi:hypothetical protein
MHGIDVVPVISALRLPTGLHREPPSYRDMAFMCFECGRLAAQLAAIALGLRLDGQPEDDAPPRVKRFRPRAEGGRNCSLWTAIGWTTSTTGA